jgi:hypothetical protein
VLACEHGKRAGGKLEMGKARFAMWIDVSESRLEYRVQKGDWNLLASGFYPIAVYEGGTDGRRKRQIP